VTETLRKLNATTTVVGSGTYGHPRRRVGRLVAVALAIVVVCAAATVGYSLLQPRVYGAQVDFLVTPRPDISDAAVDRAMMTQLMIVTSDPVLQPVAGRFGMSVQGLRDNVTAEMVGRSNILRLTVGDRDRSRAVELAGLIAGEYLNETASVLGVPDGPDAQPPTRSTVLSAASPLPSPLQPRLARALAAGVLLGLLAGAVAVVVLIRPRWLSGPAAGRR
jgi:capsular polysaccharide biosynthesis protein